MFDKEDEEERVELTLRAAVVAAHDGASVIYVAPAMRMGLLLMDSVMRQGADKKNTGLFKGLFPCHVFKPWLDTINVNGGGKFVGSIRFLAKAHCRESLQGWRGRVFVDPECWPLDASTMESISVCDPTAFQQWMA